MSKAHSQDGRTEASRSCEDTHAVITHRRRSQSGLGRLALVFLLVAPTLALLASFILRAGKAHAAPAPPLPNASAITITAETQTFTYATQITFQVSASDNAGKISSAQLEIMVQAIGIDRHVDVPVPQPSASVSLSYRYDPSGDYLPPYSPITYRWTLSDNARHSLTGTEEHFDFADTRFAWQHLTRSNISVYWYNQATSYGQQILDTAVQEAASIEQDLNGTLTDPVKILVYASNDDLQAGLPSDSPNWAGGVALIPFEEALIVVGEQSYALLRDLPHELTHLILHQTAGVNCGGCPLWFDEGMAVYHQLYHEPEMQFAFENAVKEDKLLPFNSLTDHFPDDTDLAEIAYAQSWNYIKYLYRLYTQPKVARLVNALRTNNFARAFQQAFGLAPDTMENQWRASLGIEPIGENPQTTPSTGPGTSGQSAGAPGLQNASGILSALAIVAFVLLASGLVTAMFLMRRSSLASAATTAAPWAIPAAGTPPSLFPVPPDAQAGYPPAPMPQGISTDPRYQGQIERRQALLRSIEESIATEKRLHIQQAELEYQIALATAQEEQARAAGNEHRATQALERRQTLEAQLSSAQQHVMRVRMQRLEALRQERHISATIDAAFSQSAMLVSQAQSIPPPKRHVSQE